MATFKTLLKDVDEAVFYLIETSAGPPKSGLEAVKVGSTIQVMYGRLRAYHQPGTLYTSCTWTGHGSDIDFLERKFKKEFDNLNMKHTFPGTSPTEVFIGKKSEYVKAVDEMIARFSLDITFQYDNYDCGTSESHKLFVGNLNISSKYFDLFKI